ncbi:MAG TPA: VOC family protein [Rhodocyclaceae bacterium]|nr:VOC family protein [Rhodocyclaceae bacterium]
MLIQPYLNFDGRCEEAIDFYTKSLGAKLEMIMRYKEAPDSPPPGMVAPGSENKIMHSAFRIGESLIMGSDGYCGGKASFHGVTLSINVKDEAEADRVFNALSEGGKVQMPIGKTFFSPRFGMVEDKFGLGWMVIVPAPM